MLIHILTLELTPPAVSPILLAQTFAEEASGHIYILSYELFFNICKPLRVCVIFKLDMWDMYAFSKYINKQKAEMNFPHTQHCFH